MQRWIILAQNTNDIKCSQSNKNVVFELDPETKRQCGYLKNPQEYSIGVAFKRSGGLYDWIIFVFGLGRRFFLSSFSTTVFFGWV